MMSIRSLRCFSQHRRPSALVLLALALAFGTAQSAQTNAPLKKKKKPAVVKALGKSTSKSKPIAAADAPDLVTYGQREDVMRFASEVAERRQLDPHWVRAALAQSRFVPAVTRFIMPPPAGTAKNWAAYRSRFVEPLRIKAGLVFWQANESWLKKAEAQWGVPPEIVVGIVGVETIYGQQMGNFRVIDALATLAFDFPAGRRDRSDFFRTELEGLLVLSHQQGADPLSFKGSYAGAIGMPQFMPSSISSYAIDFDGDGRVDLNGNAADVIGSVAHYLSKFGWQAGLATHFAVAAPVEVSDRAVLLAPDILPQFTPQEFAERGALLEAAAQATPGKLALVELQNGDAAPSYVAGTTNFYAITRYNWSSYYAMAVIELGNAVKQRAQSATPLPATHLNAVPLPTTPPPLTPFLPASAR